jgi:hypothetical protein
VVTGEKHRSIITWVGARGGVVAVGQRRKGGQELKERATSHVAGASRLMMYLAGCG